MGGLFAREGRVPLKDVINGPLQSGSHTKILQLFVSYSMQFGSAARGLWSHSSQLFLQRYLEVFLPHSHAIVFSWFFSRSCEATPSNLDLQACLQASLVCLCNKVMCFMKQTVNLLQLLVT